MAAIMYMVLLVVAVGTTSVFASRDVPGLANFGNALTGQAATLVDVPGLKITMRTEPPTEIPGLGTLLNRNAGPLTISITDRIEGTWLNPVTFTSTTKINPDIVSTLLQKLIGGLPTGLPTGIPGIPTGGIHTSIHPTKPEADDDDDDDVVISVPDVDVPDIDTSSKTSTVHFSISDFRLPSLNFSLPRWTFPFGRGSPSPSPTSPPPSRHPRTSPSPSSSPLHHRRETSPSPPPPQRESANFHLPGFNLPIPRWPFPLGGSSSPPASSPSSPPPPPRHHVTSPSPSSSPASSPSPPRRPNTSPTPSSSPASSPPPPRRRDTSPTPSSSTASPPPPRHETSSPTPDHSRATPRLPSPHRSSDATSPRSSHEDAGN